MATTALKRRPRTKTGHSRSALPATKSTTPSQRTASPSITQRSRLSSQGGSHAKSAVTTMPTGTIHRSPMSARRPVLTLKGETAATADRTSAATAVVRRAGSASRPETLPHAAALTPSNASVQPKTISQRAMRVPSPRVTQPDGRLRLEHPEGEALHDVEVHLRRVVRRVADREIAADHQLEVAAAGTEHDGAVDARRPDHLAVDDVLDHLEDREPARTHGLHEAGEAAGAERDGIGAAHAGHLERAHGLGHRAGVGAVVVLDLDGLVRRALADATDPGGFPSVEDRPVLGARDVDGGVDERIEIGIGGAARDVVELGA